MIIINDVFLLITSDKLICKISAYIFFIFYASMIMHVLKIHDYKLTVKRKITLMYTYAIAVI